MPITKSKSSLNPYGNVKQNQQEPLSDVFKAELIQSTLGYRMLKDLAKVKRQFDFVNWPIAKDLIGH